MVKEGGSRYEWRKLNPIRELDFKNMLVNLLAQQFMN